MANLSLIERLDQALDAIIANREATPPLSDAEIAPLLRIAAELRDLPRQEFRARLKDELAEVTFAEMQRSSDALQKQEDNSAVLKEKGTAASPIREGFRTVTPYLVVTNLHEEIDFIKKVFAAEGQVYGIGSAGGFHSEYKIGDSMLMIGGGGEGSTWHGTPAPATLHI